MLGCVRARLLVFRVAHLRGAPQAFETLAGLFSCLGGLQFEKQGIFKNIYVWRGASGRIIVFINYGGATCPTKRKTRSQSLRPLKT